VPITVYKRHFDISMIHQQACEEGAKITELNRDEKILELCMVVSLGFGLP
jgi:hypothetical protein